MKQVDPKGLGRCDEQWSLIKNCISRAWIILNKITWGCDGKYLIIVSIIFWNKLEAAFKKFVS